MVLPSSSIHLYQRSLHARSVFRPLQVTRRPSATLNSLGRGALIGHHACKQKRPPLLQQDQARRSTVVCSGGLVKGMVGSWVSSIHALEPQLAYVADRVDDIILPIFAGWLFIQLISGLADRARQWCDAHPDEPLSLEMVGLLPAALEGPSRVAVSFLVLTRVLRNLAGMLAGYVDTFQPRLHTLIDVPVRSLMSALGPIDHMLINIYIVVAVALSTRILIKYKSIFFDYIIKRQRAEELGLDDYKNSSSTGSSSSNIGSSSMASSSASSMGSSGELAGMGSDSDSEHGMCVDNTPVMCTEGIGRQLSVAMSPRSSVDHVAAVTAVANGPSNEANTVSSGSNRAADTLAASSGGAAVSAAARLAGGVTGSAFAAAKAAARKTSRYTSLVYPGRELGGKSADDLERLLLPLDSILSWVLVVIAVLFTVQFLGVNIQPLLAVGGASSIIIGLATQTLLTNAVMGVNIFLSRPFVPGDAITVQGPSHMIISGTVERVTPMRTMMRTDDDVLVTMPNKTIADMVIYNKSRRDMRKRFSPRNRERQYLKFKVKLPHKDLENLEGLQEALRQTLRRPGVSQQSIELGLSKFTDVGAEVLVKCLLLVPLGSETGQKFLLDMSLAVRKHGANLVSIT